jgi:hypothetical protein
MRHRAKRGTEIPAGRYKKITRLRAGFFMSDAYQRGKNFLSFHAQPACEYASATVWAVIPS